MPMDREGFMYCAKSGDLIKIGFSGAPQERVAQLRSISGRKDLTLHASLPANSRDEFYFHKKYLPLRVPGYNMREWYPANSEAFRAFFRMMKASKGSYYLDLGIEQDKSILTDIPFDLFMGLRSIAQERRMSVRDLAISVLSEFISKRN